MKFSYRNLENCHDATGLVVVVDVVRAFTNAAFIFWRGASKVYPVAGVEEALAFRAAHAGAMACGEVNGIPPAGFDFGNSPAQTATLDLQDRIIVQRTGAGTQGIVRSQRAGALLAASFVVAEATRKTIERLAPVEVTFVISGQRPIDDADEDLSCAEYLEKLLRHEAPDPAPYLQRVRASKDARPFFDGTRPDLRPEDIGHCCEVNRFDFAMLAAREEAQYVMRAVYP